jgi:hypothetical protein
MNEHVQPSPDAADELSKAYKAYDVTRGEIELGESQKLGLEQAFEVWKPHYDDAVDLFQSKISVALREGRVSATGRLLGGTKLSDAVAVMKDQGPRVSATAIPAAFWRRDRIDFENSAAYDGVHLYCYITCKWDEVLIHFPADHQAANSIERVGDSFVLEDDSQAPPRAFRSRGRPLKPWDPFHLEVASMLHAGTLPQKKESAIEHFRDWFRRDGVEVSRSAISERLTPYYGRFMKKTENRND